MLAFQLVAEALDAPHADGKKRWDQAQQRLLRRQLQLPPTARVKVPGARQPTPQLAANDAAKALRLVLKKPLEEFFGKEEKLAWLRRKVEAAGGDPATVDAELAEILKEKAQSEADAQSIVLPGLRSDAQVTLRTTRENGEVLGSVLDYLRWLGIEDVKHVWNYWLREEFHMSRVLIDEAIAYAEKQIDVGAGQRVTPFTNFAGYRLLTKLCMHKSKIAQAMYDQALVLLGRASVGDQRLHAALDSNAAAASTLAQDFVLGAEEAEKQMMFMKNERSKKDAVVSEEQRYSNTETMDRTQKRLHVIEADTGIKKIRIDTVYSTTSDEIKTARSLENCTTPFVSLVKERIGCTSPRQVKQLTRAAYGKFLSLVAQETQRDAASVRIELRSGIFGLHASIPEKWLHLASAAVEALVSPEGTAVPVPGPVEHPVRHLVRNIVRRTAFVATGVHAKAKDAANTMWIQMLKPGGHIFFLDSWSGDEGLELRTTRALKLAGHYDHLYSANTDVSICDQLRREGVIVHEGSWSEMTCSTKLDGIYLDMCSGSETYVRSQLELATTRSASGCILAWTLTERDFNGEPILLRVMALGDFLRDQGWNPALHRMRASTMLHRSGKGQQVVTQLWKKI
jgi:hypothetical protein